MMLVQRGSDASAILGSKIFARCFRNDKYTKSTFKHDNFSLTTLTIFRKVEDHYNLTR